MCRRLGGVAVHRLCRALLILSGLAALGGCETYERAPLRSATSLAPTVANLTGDAVGPLSGRKLDRLVLRNNPDLVAARARIGVADAQLLQAGVLPNPQFTGSFPLYLAGPDGSNGFAVGLAQDVRSILLRPTKREVASNAAAEVNASLLWQEWQTIGKARLLYVDLVMEAAAAKLAAKNRKLIKDRFDRATQSIAQGNAPLATLSPDLAALSEVARSEDDIERARLARRHQLAALLGLSPDAPLRLMETVDLTPLDPAQVRADVASISQRRPDLIALQYGYRSQDAKLRQAILAQFPNLIVSLAGGRDTNAIYSVTPQASVDLPIFDRNEGNIAIERATCAELEREFHARLATATGEIEALLSESLLARRQLAALEPRLLEARAIAGKTEQAFAAGNFDERAYVDIEVALLTQEQQKLALRQSLLEGQATLSMLTGAGLPRVSLIPEPPPADPLGLLHAFSR